MCMRYTSRRPQRKLAVIQVAKTGGLGGEVNETMLIIQQGSSILF